MKALSDSAHRLRSALRAEAAASGAVASLLERVERYVSTPRPRRVLVVEDEKAVRLFLERALTAAGVEVVAVETVAGAREALADGPAFGLALIDMALPDGDGLDLARTLPRDVRAVLMSATVDEGLLWRVSEKVGATFLAKDFAAEEDAVAFVTAVLAELAELGRP